MKINTYFVRSKHAVRCEENGYHRDRDCWVLFAIPVAALDEVLWASHRYSYDWDRHEARLIRPVYLKAGLIGPIWR